MLKRLFVYSVLHTLILLGAMLMLPPPASAESCCATGYTFTSNACLKDAFRADINNFCINTLGPVNDFIVNFPETDPDPFEELRDDFPQVCIDALESVATIPADDAALCARVVSGITNPPPGFMTLYSGICPAAVNAILAQHTDKVAAAQCPFGQSCDTNGQCVDQIVFIPVQICNYIADSGDRGDCNECFNRPDGGVYTPFGCIDTSPNLFIQRILQIAISLAGGIAFLMILYGAFVTMTSAGNPERLNGGREIITSAVAGLLLIIFSTIILRIIGVDILQLPGL